MAAEKAIVPKLKHFIVRKPKQMKSSEALEDAGAKMVYTIACKVSKDPSFDESALPGSLEEQFYTPEDYLAIEHARPKEIPKKQANSILKPLDVHAEAELERKRRNQISKQQQAEARPKTCTNKTVRQKAKEEFNKDATMHMDQNDTEIRNQYAKLSTELRPRPSSAALLNSRIKMARDFSNNQPNVFDAYAASQNRWDKFLKDVCKKLKRQPFESVVSRATEYRERLEKVAARQKRNPFLAINGSQGWCLSLRSSEQYKESRNCSIPMTSVHTGLHIKIIDNPYKQEPIIRVPTAPQGKFRKYKRKGAVDQTVDDIEEESRDLHAFIVIGKSAYELEVEGFARCQREKTVRVAPERYNNPQI